MNSRALHQFRHQIKRSWLGRNFAVLLMLAFIVVAMATYISMTHKASPLGPNPTTVWGLLLVNLGLLGALSAIIGRRIVFLWKAIRRGIAGSRLQRRVIATFSIIVILPTLLVTIFSIVFFSLGVQAWFNDRVKTAVTESLAVAEAYLSEHKENIRAESLSMASEIGRAASLALSDPVEFNRFVSAQASVRSLSEVIVFQHNRIIAQGRFTFAAAFESLPLASVERARNGEVVLLENDDDKIRALTELPGMDDTFLLIGRLIDAQVLSHMEKTQGAVYQYKNLQGNLKRLQITFSLLFVSFTMLLLLAAIWHGMQFAMRLVTPISRLVVAAGRIKSGDYDVRVDVGDEDDEISSLSRAFNRMGEQLSVQRTQLIEVNRRLDDRRRFTEAVLEGVSAGVMALNKEGEITLANRSAEAVLKKNGVENLHGVHADNLLPGIAVLLAQANADHGASARGTLTIGTGERARTLHANVSAENGAEGVQGYIVTFDDITLLVSAQRHAAWSDVARRVAHEIKNPLTPIALAAERLKRKYLKFIDPEEAETFSRYTDTIGKHVSDIGRMVDEFVSFARMPNPVFKEEDLASIIRKVAFSEQVAHSTISYEMDLPPRAVPLSCDERQLTQVLTNLLKNAAEALEAQVREHENPRIHIKLALARGGIELIVRDNGPGFPPDQIDRLMEPYVTTRAKGSGLGLAIARKIVEDHNGEITISNQSIGGAEVRLFFLPQSDITNPL